MANASLLMTGARNLACLDFSVVKLAMQLLLALDPTLQRLPLLFRQITRNDPATTFFTANKPTF
jgi:hypothetical protein